MFYWRLVAGYISIGDIYHIDETLIEHRDEIDINKVFKRPVMHDGYQFEYSDKTLLMYACTVICSSTEIIKFLLENGADPNTQNKYGKTVLHYIGDYHDPIDKLEFLKLLLEYGADINKQDNNGNTILHTIFESISSKTFFSFNGIPYPYYIKLKICSKIAKLLSKYNLNMDLKNSNDQTALDMIYEGQFSTNSIEYIIKFLEILFKNPLKKKIEKLEKKNLRLEREIERLKYVPGSIGYQEAFDDFENLVKKISKK